MINLSFKEWIDAKYRILTESKQSIINLGYPEIVAKLFYERYGQLAFLMAKWYKDYKTPQGYSENDWFSRMHFNYRAPSIGDYAIVYQASFNPEEYVKALKNLDIPTKDVAEYDEYHLQQQREFLKKRIAADLFDDPFFSFYALTKDIASGKLKNFAPYKGLNFWEAENKYNAKSIFEDKQPIKVYKDGFKWIDVGKSCNLIGDLMGNCGSAGLMGMDGDRTLLVLFDSMNKPHAIVLYSPNEKRISHDEGVASTPLKDKYHRYVLDLAKHLGVRFDHEKSKSHSLRAKAIIQGKGVGFKPLQGNDAHNHYFQFKGKDGNVYYTDGYSVILAQDYQRAQQAISNGQLKIPSHYNNTYASVFHHYNQPALVNFGLKYTPLNLFGVTPDSEGKNVSGT